MRGGRGMETPKPSEKSMDASEEGEEEVDIRADAMEARSVLHIDWDLSRFFFCFFAAGEPEEAWGKEEEGVAEELLERRARLPFWTAEVSQELEDVYWEVRVERAFSFSSRSCGWDKRGGENGRIGARGRGGQGGEGV